MTESTISYDRAVVLDEIPYHSARTLPVLADRYVEEAEMLRRVHDNAGTNDGACRVAEAARGLCALHARDDEDFTTEIFLAIVFHTLRMARGYWGGYPPGLRQEDLSPARGHGTVLLSRAPCEGLLRPKTKERGTDDRTGPAGGTA